MTEAWDSGYVEDVVYTLGFYRELAPSLLDYVCLINGIEGLPSGRPLRYCELGCGRGYGTTLLAASNPDISVVGIDFNRSHITEARAFAERAGIANVTFLELEFGEAARSDDPQLRAFDIVALHGVYAWVAPPVRAAIHDFIRSKLLSGGIAFVSYNAFPGASRMIATQRMLIEVANRTTGDSLARVAEGMQLLRLLVDKSEGMIAQHGALSKKYFSQLATKDKHYLVHEFLNAGWQPFFATDTISAMAKAGLSFVGSASIAENRIELCVPRDLRETVRSAPDVAMRELLKDYIVNNQFRRDVYVRGPRSLDPTGQRQRLMGLTFVPMPAAQLMPEKLDVPVGKIAPRKELLQALWPRLQDQAVTGAEVVSAAAKAGANEQFVWPLIEMLVHNRFIHPARVDAAKVDRSACQRLNEMIIDMSCSADTHKYLASPVLGSAIHTSHPDRVIASVLRQEPGLDDLSVADKAIDRVNGTGQHFMREGRPVAKNDKNVRGLAGFVREFRERRLPRWQALGVVE